MAHARIVADEATLAKFIAFLAAGGTRVAPRAREKFRGTWNGGIATIVAAAKGKGWQLSPSAFEAWNEFQTAQAVAQLRAVAVSARRANRFKSIARRDGAVCFYCDRALTPTIATIEHLVARAHNGPGNLRNLALACEPCNKEARDLPVVHKVRLRDSKRGVDHEHPASRDRE